MLDTDAVRRRPSAHLVASAGGAALGALVAWSGTAVAHDINQGWRTVADNGATCVQARAEIDHDEDVDRNRMFWVARSRTAHLSTGAHCASSRTAQMRLKGYRYHREQSNEPWVICTGTVGDGLGEPGYLHRNTDTLDVNSSWVAGGPCGGGEYLGQTWGHVQNNGWIGGHTNSGVHLFK